jgi:hypothetical protein
MTDQKKQTERLTMKEAAKYVNDRLTRKWQNPVSALESNLYRGKLEMSKHGRNLGKRTFEVKELERFIEDKNSSAAPAGGRTQMDLSEYNELFGYHSDVHIANLAGCSAITVMRYRDSKGIPSYRDSCKARIEGIRDRLGKEPAGKLAKEIGVNRMTIVRFMKAKNIAPYVRKAGSHS